MGGVIDDGYSSVSSVCVCGSVVAAITGSGGEAALMVGGLIKEKVLGGGGGVGGACSLNSRAVIDRADSELEGGTTT